MLFRIAFQRSLHSQVINKRSAPAAAETSTIHFTFRSFYSAVFTDTGRYYSINRSLATKAHRNNNVANFGISQHTTTRFLYTFIAR